MLNHVSIIHLIGLFIRPSNDTTNNYIDDDTAPDMSWNEYHSYDEISSYLKDLNSTYDFVNVSSIGKSYEGRDIYVIEISAAEPGTHNNIFVEGGKSFVG